ncbi:LysR family transcriptional regulator [Bosea caraganae]|uniref:LysR family transcriptional regulator n=1 Tax=Bosea caraganae TaxID=2763117 RepID=A0A370KYC3_9HYPH|nr:LysR family transcriptional regulator [Bosea caraganae]RDJ19994.1 LysR family transcriptional regulator [Bosea caraganae]RDJ23934.1 LysR family transcriptional regulator [Bosea caraganae]
MELRHLRYFVAVAEEGNLTVAAEKRLHTAQPSLSRQLRDLEQEVGAQLFTRHARGIDLTPAGKAFLDHARLALGQAKEAVAAARRAARPAKASFAVGFLTGQEVDWLPRVTQILRAELPGIDFRVSSLYSPDLADALQSGEVDLGFLRVEPRPDVVYQVVAHEPLVAILPSDHRLAGEASIDPRDLADEIFVGFSDVPHVLRDVVDSYLKRNDVILTPSHHIDNFAMGMSLVASTRGVALLPAYVEPLLPWSVVSRPLQGQPPTIDLAVGYRRDNASPVLKTFLAGIDRLIAAGPAGIRSGA